MDPEEQQQLDASPASTQQSGESKHYLVSRIFGTICTQCNETILAKGNNLYPPDEKTCRRHLESNNCYDGTKVPNCYDVERELILSQNAIHTAAKSNEQIAREKIDEMFPNGTTTTHKAFACKRCGYFNKKRQRFNDHYGPNNIYDCQQSIDAFVGKVDICVGRYGIACPKQILEDTASGTFNIPTKRSRKNRHRQMPNRTAAAASTSINNNSFQHSNQTCKTR